MEYHDSWTTYRWGPHYKARWPEGWAAGQRILYDKPRTCSYCGGAHPDDVIALMERGWWVEATDKNYKRYLHAPSGLPEPSPPVKIYVQHFSEAQVDRFNKIILAKGKIP